MFRHNKLVTAVVFIVVMVMGTACSLTINVPPGTPAAATAVPGAVPKVNVTDKTANLAVSGTACKDTFYGASSVGSQFIVFIKVKNRATTDFVFDRADARFLAGTYALRVAVSKVSDDPYVLGPGEEDKWDFDTDGYTTKLLTDAGGKAMGFRIDFIRDEKTIAGPYAAALPTLSKLPLYSGLGIDDGLNECAPLTFSLSQFN